MTFCTNLRKTATETLAMILQTFWEEIMSRTRMFEWKIRNSPRSKKGQQVTSKVRSMYIILFDIKGIVHTEFVLAGQTVNTVYYCDCTKMCEDFAPLWHQRNCLLHHDNSMIVISEQPYSPDFAPCDFFVSPMEDTVILPLLRRSRRHRRQY
jgi:hypothetical protein